MRPEFRIFVPVLMLLASAGVLCGQTTQHDKELNAFERAEISGDFQVEVVESPDYSISITVDDLLLNYVQAYVDGGVLKVYLDEKKLAPDIRRHYRSRLSDTPVLKAKIAVPSVLRSVSLSGNAVLKDVSGNVFAPDSARFFLSGESRIESLSVKSSRTVQLRLDRRCTADMTVGCTDFLLDMSGSSSAEISAECSVCSVHVAANASCVWSGRADDLKVNARGTSRSIFNGESPSAEYVVAGSADINAENLKTVDAKVDMTGFCSLTQSASGSLFINMSNGSRLVYKNSPVFFINSVKNSSISRYYEDSADNSHDSTGFTL